MIDFECTIVGAGIVGLAIARRLSQHNRSILILEKNKNFGEENSSHNSGVIHAGIYYKKNSLKAKHCIDGNSLLYRYAKEREINHAKCGKLIVASSDQEINELMLIKSNASKFGINLTELNKEAVKNIEPEIECNKALLSENTGIIDVYQLMLNMVGDIENQNGIILYNNNFNRAEIKNNFITVFNNKNERVKTSFLINCAGLHSETVAQNIIGSSFKVPKTRFVKGNYLKLIGKNNFKRLIYPIPQKDGLGIHLTINLNAEIIFGPDTENIGKIDFSMKDDLDRMFKKSIKKYWPGIEKRKIVNDYCGIRPKLKNGDFLVQNGIERDENIINLHGIESPGLTSSLSLGNFIGDLVNKSLENA